MRLPEGRDPVGDGAGVGPGGASTCTATSLEEPWASPPHRGLRPEPFFLGIAYAALGLGLSALAVRETREHARTEAALHPAPANPDRRAELTTRQIARTTSHTDRVLSSAGWAS
ncbi:hypothetical protein [Kitasatospora sp. KL5]|uniref:hypothetical protein n=1 Tax=Kitasatospora sp. KL5 TaxID=3425125 RepID=UPI003D6DBBA5